MKINIHLNRYQLLLLLQVCMTEWGLSLWSVVMWTALKSGRSRGRALVYKISYFNKRTQILLILVLSNHQNLVKLWWFDSTKINNNNFISVSFLIARHIPYGLLIGETNQIKSNELLVLGERGKPKYPRKNPFEQSREQVNSIHVWQWVRK